MFSKGLSKPKHSNSFSPKSNVATAAGKFDGNSDFKVYIKETAEKIATDAEAGGTPSAIFFLESPSYGAPKDSPSYKDTPPEFLFQTVPSMITDEEMVLCLAEDNVKLPLVERINLMSKLQQSYTFSTTHNTALTKKLTLMRKRVQDTISETLFKSHFKLNDSFCECMYKLSLNAGGVMSGANMVDQQYEAFLLVKQSNDECIQSTIQRLELFAERCTTISNGIVVELISKSICRARITNSDFCQQYLQSEVLKGKLANEEYNPLVKRLIDADSLLRPIHIAKLKTSSFSAGKNSSSVPSSNTIIAAAKTVSGGTTTTASLKPSNGCQHCLSQGGTGKFANYANHHDDNCFKLHPELKLAFEEKRGQSRTAHIASSTPSRISSSSDTDDDYAEDEISAGIRAVYTRNCTPIAQSVHVPTVRHAHSCKSRPVHDEIPGLVSDNSSDSEDELTTSPAIEYLSSTNEMTSTVSDILDLSSTNEMTSTVSASLDLSSPHEMISTVGTCLDSSTTTVCALVSTSRNAFQQSNANDNVSDPAINSVVSSWRTHTIESANLSGENIIPPELYGVPLDLYVSPFIYGRACLDPGYLPIDTNTAPSIPDSVRVFDTSSDFQHANQGVPYSRIRPLASSSPTLYLPNLRMHMLRVVTHMLKPTVSLTMDSTIRMYILLQQWRVFGIRFLGQETNIDPTVCAADARLYRINEDSVLFHLLRLQSLILNAFETGHNITDNDFIRQVYNVWQGLGIAIHFRPHD